jgi:hypothetical protein
MSEASAVQSFLNAVKAFDENVHVQRLEDKFSVGIPDINLCCAGEEYWFEAKFIEDWPKRLTTGVKIPLRPEQTLWARLGAKAGRRVKCITRIASWGWMVHDAAFTEFGLLRDGVFNKDEILKRAVWSGKTLNIQEILDER